jgi:hypothetical protein
MSELNLPVDRFEEIFNHFCPFEIANFVQINKFVFAFIKNGLPTGRNSFGKLDIRHFVGNRRKDFKFQS